jgi:hypothetical protein
MGPDELRAYIEADDDVPANTDDYPYLEYFVPGDLYYATLDNVREFAPHFADPTTLVQGLSESEAKRVRALAAERQQGVLTRDPEAEGRSAG